MTDPIDAAILSNATGPASVTQDQTTINQHALDQQIKAARFLKAQSAANRKSKGLRFMRIAPPGTV